VRRAEAGERPDDHAFAQERLVDPWRLVADLDVEEVADGVGQRFEAVLAQDARELDESLGVQLPAARDLALIVEARERGGCAGLVTSNGRRVFAIAAATSGGATA